uniref:Uncharacterized protein n=1 Tax=Pelusios castaneus TaxID=367368 RepID=A0A8C8RB11_9SAUR
MIRAFSFPVSPERGRLRGWLEGSLAGLCELHLLRELQERRVRQALRLGTDPGEQAAGETEPGSAGEPAPEEQLVSPVAAECLGMDPGSSADGAPGVGGDWGPECGPGLAGRCRPGSGPGTASCLPLS